MARWVALVAASCGVFLNLGIDLYLGRGLGLWLVVVGAVEYGISIGQESEKMKREADALWRERVGGSE